MNVEKKQRAEREQRRAPQDAAPVVQPAEARDPRWPQGAPNPWMRQETQQ